MGLYKLRDVIDKIYYWICSKVRFLRAIYETRGTGNQITLTNIFKQKIIGYNRFVPWPVHPSSTVFGIRWIKIGVNTAPGLSFGNYIFAKEGSPVEIGDYTLVAPNVCIAGFSHDIYNIHSYSEKGGVSIGAYCWLGANCVVLPGVILGEHTVVAAGSVVTKSFEEGYCVIGGNPAKILKTLDINKVVKHKSEFEYIGYKKVR